MHLFIRKRLRRALAPGFAAFVLALFAGPASVAFGFDPFRPGSTTGKAAVPRSSAVQAPVAQQASISDSGSSGGMTITVSNSPHVSEVRGAKATFTIRLNKPNPSNTPVRVRYNTGQDSAKAGFDYQPTSGEVSFTKNQQAKTVTVPVIDNVGPDEKPVERFFLYLNSASGAKIARGTGIAEIFENERYEVTRINVNDAPPVFEAPNRKGLRATFTVTLSNPSDVPVTVRFFTSNGSAKAGEDYRATSGSIRFEKHQQSKTVSVDVLNDTTPNQPNPKTFFLNLSNPQSGRIDDGRGLGRIFERS